MSELTYWDKEGSMECLALLMSGSKTTSELAESIDASENTVRARIKEGVTHGYIEQLKTYSINNRYRLIEGSVPETKKSSILRLKNMHERQDTPNQLYRDQFNDYSNDGGHINSPYGASHLSENDSS